MYLMFESGTFKALPLGKTFEETRGQVFDLLIEIWRL